MSTPTVVGPRSPLALDPEQTEFTDVQIEALRLIARWRTDPPAAALNLLFYGAVTSGLNPFLEQIRLLQRRETVATARGTQIEERWSVETSIHGFRIAGRRAARKLGLLLQSSKPLFHDDRARGWVDAWPYDTPPVAAQYTLTAAHPDSRVETVDAVVHYCEFVKTTLSGAPSQGWEKMPCHMLAKCAEADAWRRLFPSELGWLRLADSTDTANEPTSARPDTTDQHTDPQDAVDLLGPPRIPSDPSAAADATTADTPAITPVGRRAAAANPAPAPANAISGDTATTTASPAKRAARAATGRRRAATATNERVQEFLTAAATTLGCDADGVLGWATEQLERPISTIGDLDGDDLARLWSALPPPSSVEENDAKP
ncbi:recombinase RecT [Nocardia abscessus]|uniref:recombinase RecT n=1 Tax=Nocardia abscessus TaxID=120957 RepID=UPI0018943400|nr:recombinase RecT [Nocardia abscessus]MBF6341276.1 recombinase RecT [Nocardia abscessus]